LIIKIACSNCGCTYKVEKGKIPPEGARFRCRECQAHFYAYPSSGAGGERAWSVWTISGIQENLPLRAVVEMIRSGDLLDSDSVRVPGAEEWLVAGRVPEIRRFFSHAGQPAPPAEAAAEPGGGSRSCSTHTDRPAKWICPHCDTFFCDLCVTRKRIQTITLLWCEKCEDQLLEVQPEMVQAGRRTGSLKMLLQVGAIALVLAAVLVAVTIGHKKNRREAVARDLCDSAVALADEGDYGRALALLNQIKEQYPKTNAWIAAEAELGKVEAVLAEQAERKRQKQLERRKAKELAARQKMARAAGGRRASGSDRGSITNRCCCRLSSHNQTYNRRGSVALTRTDRWQVSHSWKTIPDCTSYSDPSKFEVGQRECVPDEYCK